jgi:hypothetical protein
LRRIEFLLFLASLAFLTFLFGFLSSHYKLFPSVPLERALAEAEALKTDTWRPNHLFRAVYRRTGVQVLDAGAVQPGVTLLTSHWPEIDWRPGIKVVDSAGRLLHLWETDPGKIWPEAQDRRSLRRKYVHGSYLFPNGDVLFNIEYEGLVRMDACGNVVWRLPQKTHHSLTRDHEGNFWACGSRTRGQSREDETYLRQFAGLHPPVDEDYLTRVSPDGKILTSLSLLKVLYDNNLQHYLPMFSKLRSGDILHLNDVESLSPELADEYPLFAAGDLVISMRSLNLVLVLDPKSGRVKWHAIEPFILQHDPDFVGLGWIALFDNNTDLTFRGTMLGGSRIVALRPHTGEVEVRYPTPGAETFYTQAGGKWQQLENGNLLITEARAGRVFEVTAAGKLVWQWFQQHYRKDRVSEVLEGSRYPYTSEQVSAWPCSPKTEN